MYLMYVDESGDPGNNTAQSEYFCLTGLIVHESEWHTLIDRLMRFRRSLMAIYGLPVRAEVHAVKFVRHSQFGIEKYRRLAILRNYIDELAKMNFISLTNVVVDKKGKPPTYDVFASAWRTLFQRFENTMTYGNFPGGDKQSFGTVFTDATNGEKLVQIMRKMSTYNPVPYRRGEGYRNIPIRRVIEDPSSRNSEHSLPIQSCDVVAYFLQQSLKPNSYIKKSGAQNYFSRLGPTLNQHASKSHSLGVVML